MRKIIFCFLLTLAGIGQLAALDTSTWRPVFPNQWTFTVPAGEKRTDHVLDVPAVAPKAGYKIIMYFDARLLFQRRAGWNNSLGIAVNDVVLEENTPSGSPRVVNRAAEQKFQGKATQSLWDKSGYYPGILTFYAPDSSKNIHDLAQCDREEKYFYAVDVTDLVKNAPNKVVFSNFLPLKQANSALQIKDLKFYYVPEKSIKLPPPRPYAPEGYEPVSNDRVAFRIPTGDKKITSYSFELPAVAPRKGYGVVLVFDCRMESVRASGWNPWYSISLNGKNLTPKNSSERHRLLRRGEIMKNTLKDEQWWFKRGNHNCIMAFFATPGGKEVDARVRSAREEKFRYCIDVTDLVNYTIIGADDRTEGGEPNKFTFYNHLPKHVADLAVLVKNLHLCYVPEAEILKESGFKLTDFTPAPPQAVLTLADAKVFISPGGGMSIAVGSETHHLESMFSYEAVPTMKFHAFTVAAPAAGQGWSVTVSRPGPGEVLVVGKGKDYTVERTIKQAGHRLTVTDKITNTGAKELGLCFYQSVGRSGTALGAGSRLAGQSEAVQTSSFGQANPTAFSSGSAGGVGLVAEDTVSRRLIDLRKVGNTVRLGSSGMGFAPGKSKTLQWAVYPVAGDYFDFINRVRHDWKVNYTIPGPLSLQDWSYIHAAAPYKFLFPWYNYAEGAGLTKQEYTAKVAAEMEKFRQLNKNVKFIGALETNLIPFDCSKVSWGEELKPRRGPRKQAYVKYGMPMSKALTAKMDAVSPYRDSFIRNETGCIMYENFYDEYPWVTTMVQPEIGNHRFQTILEDVDFLMDELKMSGVYFDQFQPYTIGGAGDDRWDGHTVTLDETGKIARKRYDYGITGAPGRAAIIRHITGKGGIIVANGQATSAEEQSLGMIAFQEMENDPIDLRAFMDAKPPEFPWQVMCHVGSPVILGARPNRYSKKDEGVRPKLQTKSIITALRNGLVHYHYHFNITLKPGPNYGSTAITDHMFPFTPKALHEGWIEGEERTVTALSGRYKVGGKEKPKVLFFDEKGFEKPNAFPVTGQPGAWEVEVKLNDWNEVAIMEVAR